MEIKNLDQLDWIEADIKLVKELMKKYITLI
jgi:hypothetical protein